MRLAFSIWVVLSAVTIVAGVQAQPVLKFDNGIVRVTGLAPVGSREYAALSGDEWKSVLSVYTQEARERKIDQPVAGKYNGSGGEIWFEPRYPFAPGETYYAIFSPESFCRTMSIAGRIMSGPLEMSFSVAADESPVTFIESVYPSSSYLPENLLRMYICFSAPMMPGESYKHIRLLRQDGTPIEKAFLVVDQELWDAGRKRFTLLFDPGRIKRDLRSNIDLGMPLRKGETCQLVIDSAWRDIHGRSLGKSVKKTFVVSDAQREKVFPGKWTVKPASGGRDGVSILFDRPMDHALALKYITVSNANVPVDGLPEMTDDFTWRFTPAEPWREGEYLIVISPLLEDVAGNNLNNAFDLDLSKDSRVTCDEPVQIPLTIPAVAR